MKRPTRISVAVGVAAVLLVAAATLPFETRENVGGSLYGAAALDGGTAFGKGVATPTASKAGASGPASNASGAAPPQGEASDTDGVVHPQRRVAHSAEVSVHTDDTTTLHRSYVAKATEMGGYIATEEISSPPENGGQPRIRVTVAVPTEKLDTYLTYVADEATRVVSQNRTGNDVTEEYVDLESRITNLELLEAELQELLGDIRDQTMTDTSNLLSVYREIGRVRGEIEQLEGRLNYLTEHTEMATVTIAIAPTPAVAPVGDSHWSPGTVARAALADLVAIAQTCVNHLIRLAITFVPVAIVSLTTVWVGRGAWKKFRRARTDTPDNLVNTAGDELQR